MIHPITENFAVEELVHPDLLRILGVDRCKDYVHDLALGLQELRNTFGPLVVNNWHRGGTFVNSGLRIPTSQFGAKNSAHKFGHGADPKPTDISPQDMHRAILENQHAFPFITRMEAIEYTPTWVHVEIGSRRGEIYVFNPR